LFFSVKNTSAYGFGATNAFCLWSARFNVRHLWILRAFSIIALVLGAFTAFIGGAILLELLSLDLPPYTLDAQVNFVLTTTLGTALVVMGVAVLGVVSMFCELAYVGIPSTQRDILRGHSRKYFVTEKHFSYQVMILSTAIKHRRTSPPGISDKLVSRLNSFFADEAVIKADKVIRDAGNGIKGAQMRYRAKLSIILAAMTIQENESLLHIATAEEMRTAAKQELSDHLAAIKARAELKIQKIEQLASR